LVQRTEPRIRRTAQSGVFVPSIYPGARHLDALHPAAADRGSSGPTVAPAALGLRRGPVSPRSEDHGRHRRERCGPLRRFGVL
jgi:hypothetical protein